MCQNAIKLGWSGCCDEIWGQRCTKKTTNISFKEKSIIRQNKIEKSALQIIRDQNLADNASILATLMADLHDMEPLAPIQIEKKRVVKAKRSPFVATVSPNLSVLC